MDKNTILDTYFKIMDQYLKPLSIWHFHHHSYSDNKLIIIRFLINLGNNPNVDDIQVKYINMFSYLI